MSFKADKEIVNLLESVYGPELAGTLAPRVFELIDQYRGTNAPEDKANIEALTQKDLVLITYGDVVHEEGQRPLTSLNRFMKYHLDELINTVHILPFYPYSSDDGFSVIDYRRIDPALGLWKDVFELRRHYKLMFDAVINHISQESDWFQAFLHGENPYRDWFIVPEDNWDYSKVFRPRTSPLLTEVRTTEGPKKVWTTFSADQIDLNYKNPDLLLEILDLMLFYASQGAALLRLDAIAYLWKESGTPCIHLPQTHQVIKLIRKVLELSGFNSLIITETNVPHAENISYFGEINPLTGNGDEAHMVYQFPLAPLVLHTFITGNARKILEWVETLDGQGLFFNFLASHDGIGVTPARGLLDEDEISRIVDQVIKHGGRVSYKSNPDGSETAYELNSTFYDALNSTESPDRKIDRARFLASQAIMLSLAGVPGIYYLSLFGGHNDKESLQRTGRNRSINRRKYDLTALEKLISDPNLVHAELFAAYKRMLAIRTEQAAFHPRAPQKVIQADPRLFALDRGDAGKGSSVLVLINVSNEQFKVNLDLNQNSMAGSRCLTDLLSGQDIQVNANQVELNFEPYQQYWLQSA